jgi:DNA-binding NarL/FixJ family response regulator
MPSKMRDVRRNRTIQVILLTFQAQQGDRLRQELSQNRVYDVLSTEDADVAIRLCEELHPPLFLVDLARHEPQTLAACRAIQQACFQTQIVAFNVSPDTGSIDRALLAGATGCLTEDVPIEELIRAMSEVYEHGVYLCDRARRHLQGS